MRKGDLNFCGQKFIHVRYCSGFLNSSFTFSLSSPDMLTSCSLNGEDPVVRSKRRRTIYFTYIFNIWTHIVTTAHPSSWKQKQQDTAPPPLYANLYPSKYFPFYYNVLLLLFILEFTTTLIV